MQKIGPTTRQGNDDLELMRTAEAVEAGAYVDWIEAAPKALSSEYRAYAGKVGESTIVFTVPKIDWYTPNRLMGFGLFETANEAMLDEVLRICKERAVPRFFVPLYQSNTAPERETLRRWLVERGFSLHNRWVKLARDARPVKESESNRCEFEIRKVESERGRDFAQTLVSGFGYPKTFEPWLEFLVGKPRWNHYLAFSGAQPVATGALFVKGRNGYLGLGSTLPTHRRRGAQEALIQERIKDGISLGCETFFVETEEDIQNPVPSFRNMLRAGFKLLYSRENYVLDQRK